MDKITRLKADIEKLQSEALSRTTSARLRSARRPDSAVLDRARSRRASRIDTCMYCPHKMPYSFLVTRASTPSFRPCILPKSVHMVRDSGRLSLPASVRLSKPRPVVPSTLNTSRPRSGNVDTSTLRVVASNFLARQSQCMSATQSKKCIREKIEYRNCSFRPTLNPHSERLVAEKRPMESQSAVTARLAVKEPIERLQRRQHLATEFESNVGKPEIDPHSEVLAATRRVLEPVQPVYDRLYSARSVSHAKLLGKENMTGSTNSSSPPRQAKSPNPLYAHVKGMYDLSDPQALAAQLEQSRRSKEQRTQQWREEAAKREIAECTFQPNCSKKPPPPVHRAPPVSGMDRFLETKRIAHEMRSLKKNLDDSYVSFRSDGCATTSSTRQLTVPSPFKFTTPR